MTLLEPLVEVRRLLHTNYNCVDLEALERWYGELFALNPVMRSVSDGADGTPFGLRTDTSTEAVFLYDHRGPRRTSSLELVHWISPATLGVPYPDPWDCGIQSVAYTVPDLDEVALKVQSLGGTVVRRSAEWLLLTDPEGTAVEVYLSAGESEQVYVRVIVSDLERTVGWWGRLGWRRSERQVRVPGHEIWPGTGEHRIIDEVALVPTDTPNPGVLFTRWSGPPPVGPTYGAPYHQGLYRLAMAVDDVHDAWNILNWAGVGLQPPYTFQLPGTKIADGLTILFLRDPDGILVELVHRPRSYFSA